MQSKTCSRCKKEKAIENFAKKGNGYQSMCRSCNSEYQKKHYSNNKSNYLAKARKSKQDLKIKFVKLKESTPCKDCGKKFPYYLMEFDHLRDKNFNISEAINTYSHSWKAIQAEMAKCDLVCVVCHKTREHKRQDVCYSSCCNKGPIV